MRSIGIPELLVLLVLVPFALVVWGKIFSKAGYSPWLCLTFFIPIVNVIVVCWFAFSSWPVLSELTRLRAQTGASSAPAR
jgi:hypothetical protein